MPRIISFIAIVAHPFPSMLVTSKKTFGVSLASEVDGIYRVRYRIDGCAMALDAESNFRRPFSLKICLLRV